MIEKLEILTEKWDIQKEKDKHFSEKNRF